MRIVERTPMRLWNTTLIAALMAAMLSGLPARAQEPLTPKQRAAVERAQHASQPRVRATQLPRVETLAREDLALRLGVAIERIDVVQRVPKRWTQAALECRPPTPAESSATVAGFKLSLRHGGRVYTYHTDDRRVFACPSIAAK